MAWLFERTVEAAAWLALVMTWVCIGWALYCFLRWCGTLQTGAEYELLYAAGRSTGYAVAFAVGLGALAAVDRYLFDVEE